MKKVLLTFKILCICSSFLITNGGEAGVKGQMPAAPMPKPSRMQQMKTAAQNFTTKATTGAQNLGTKMKTGLKNTTDRIQNASGKRTMKKSAKSATSAGRQEDAERRKRLDLEERAKNEKDPEKKKRLMEQADINRRKEMTATRKRVDAENKEQDTFKKRQARKAQTRERNAETQRIIQQRNLDTDQTIQRRNQKLNPAAESSTMPNKGMTAGIEDNLPTYEQATGIEAF